MQLYDTHWGREPAQSTSESAAHDPYVSIVSLRYVLPTVAALGTGWQLTPTRIITVAHVLRPGLPSGGKYFAQSFGFTDIQLDPADIDFHPTLDLAKLDISNGHSAGLPARAYADNDLLGREVAVAGRPVDPASPPPPSQPVPSQGVVWFAEVITSVTSTALGYDNLSTLPSHSGSPVLALNATADGYLVVGVHRADQSAVRISASVRDWLYR